MQLASSKNFIIVLLIVILINLLLLVLLNISLQCLLMDLTICLVICNSINTNQLDNDTNNTHSINLTFYVILFNFSFLIRYTTVLNLIKILILTLLSYYIFTTNYKEYY